MSASPRNSNVLLNDNPNRFIMFPLQHKEIYNLFKKAQSAMWSDDEIDLSQDYKFWVKLQPAEQNFIKHILAFFAASDGIVMENLAERFLKEVQIPEARAFYSLQNYIEVVHSITYSKIIDGIIDDPNEKTKLFNAIHTLPGVTKKAVWAEKWIKSQVSFATRLVAFALVEGVFFSGSFSAIFWIRHRYQGAMPGLMQANEFIMRDEGLHQDFAVYLYNNYISDRLTQEEIKEITSEAVDVEIQFMKDALPSRLVGMNIEMMSDHIKYVANRLAKQLGYEEIYPKVVQPFDWIESISLSKIGDFFAPSKETNYSTGNNIAGVELVLNEDDEF